MGSFKHPIVGDQIILVFGDEHSAQLSFMKVQNKLGPGIYAKLVENGIYIHGKKEGNGTRSCVGINYVPKEVSLIKSPVDISGPGTITRYIQFSEVEPHLGGGFREIQVQ